MHAWRKAALRPVARGKIILAPLRYFSTSSLAARYAVTAAPCSKKKGKNTNDMERIDYKTMLDIARWQHNHHPSEGLTYGLFTETFGKDLGQHFHGKWTAYFNGNLWDMLAYFCGESANGQKFCDMLLRQVSLYKKNRQRPMWKNDEAIDKDITDNLKPRYYGTL